MVESLDDGNNIPKSYYTSKNDWLRLSVASKLCDVDLLVERLAHDRNGEIRYEVARKITDPNLLVELFGNDNEFRIQELVQPHLKETRASDLVYTITCDFD